MEIIAVYWEPIIKTYGFSVKTGLSLVKLSFPADQATTLGAKIRELDNAGVGGGFTMVVGHLFDGRQMRLSLLLEGCTSDLIDSMTEKLLKKEPSVSLQIQIPVELIYFQGPITGTATA